jgi:hypothetical protein
MDNRTLLTIDVCPRAGRRPYALYDLYTKIDREVYLGEDYNITADNLLYLQAPRPPSARGACTWPRGPR